MRDFRLILNVHGMILRKPVDRLEKGEKHEEARGKVTTEKRE